MMLAIITNDPCHKRKGANCAVMFLSPKQSGNNGDLAETRQKALSTGPAIKRHKKAGNSTPLPGTENCPLSGFLFIFCFLQFYTVL
jgi:hypothetical protein